MPKKSLAELIGMTLGDGNLGVYPKYVKKKYKRGIKIPRCYYLRIYCNIEEKQYAEEIEKLLTKVFNKKPYCRYRPEEGELYLEVSRKDLDEVLEIPIGNKIKNKVRIPKWIFKNKLYLKNCLRGLFDTDGCCYVTGKKYQIINFCSKNPQLLKDVFSVFVKLNFHPFKRSKYVELGRQKEVKRFFKEIKPRNRKHYRHQNAGIANSVTARV